MKILIVDDERINLDSLSQCFGYEGHTTITASSVLEAKVIVESEIFNLALIDFWLVNGKGTEIVRLIKKLRPEAKVIGMSGTEQGSTFSKAGADFFIKKPFSGIKLLEDIKNI